MTIFKFLIEYYPTVFVLACGITTLILFRNSWPVSYRILAIFIFLYTIMDTAANILAAFYEQYNHYVYNFLYTIQFLIIPAFFYYHLKSRFLKKAIAYYFIIFPLFVIINTIWFQGIYTLQTFSYVLGGSFALLLCVAYLWQLYISEETHSIFRDPVFWFSLAWLLNFAFTVPYLGMLTYLLNNFPDFAEAYYRLVIDVSDSLRSILLMTGFLCMRVKEK